MKLSAVITILAALSLFLACTAAADSLQNLIRFRIKDQHNAIHTDSRFTGAPLLTVWGDRKGATHMKYWSPSLTDSLSSELESFRLCRLDIGHVKGAPFFVKGRIKKSFRRDWQNPVLLDWKGVFAKAYECPDDSCTIMLFNRENILTKRWVVAAPDSTTMRIILEATRKAASPLAKNHPR